MKILLSALACCLFSAGFCFGQAGMTSSPSKLFYRLAPGASGTQKVSVSNPNAVDLEVGISMGDWNYDELGNNQLYDPEVLKNSCASWIKVLPGSFFTLAPEENKDLSIVLTVPPDADTKIPVHTAMLYISQMNPGSMSTGSGAALKVSVRMGVKIYHSFVNEDIRNIDIHNFYDRTDTVKDEKTGGKLFVSHLEINMENTGKIWLEGKTVWELVNLGTGERIKLKDQDFYALPGDKRLIRKALPADLKKGKYTATAIISYGNKDELKLAELEFEH